MVLGKGHAQGLEYTLAAEKMRNIKEINSKNQIHYFFYDMINITNFDPKLPKINEKCYKKNDIYYIRYITMKDTNYVKVKSVNRYY